jgi:hypothetical protein
MKLQLSNPRDFVLPSNDERTLVVGHTGSGKTRLGFWLLSKQDLRSKPWYVLDYKGEELMDQIDRARSIEFHETPSEPGLYILHSRPDLEEDTEKWLWKIWKHERAGLFIDEAYMLPEIRKGAYDALLTQGRSKQIPVISLSQRPVRISRTAVSETNHLVAFDLVDDRDKRTLEETSPRGFSEIPVPPFHSRWYDVRRKGIWVIRPVPDDQTIVADINEQLPPRQRWI